MTENAIENSAKVTSIVKHYIKGLNEEEAAERNLAKSYNFNRIKSKSQQNHYTDLDEFSNDIDNLAHSAQHENGKLIRFYSKLNLFE